MRYNYDTKDFQVAHKLNNEILTFDDYKDQFHIVYEFLLFIEGDLEYVVENKKYKLEPYDLLLIKKIQDSTNLTNPVINVVLDYTLEKLDNKLIPAYAEKVAASLSRENIKDAYEAMLYLNGKNTKKEVKSNVKKEEPKQKVVEEALEEEYKWW